MIIDVEHEKYEVQPSHNYSFQVYNYFYVTSESTQEEIDESASNRKNKHPCRNL